jgi:PadR family transcriptional regulator, regulatory protein PadR
MTKHHNDKLQGTLDLLILKVLARGGPLHGYAIAQHIHQWTGNRLRIEDGSLYPALHRMMHDHWLKADWGMTDTKRRARFYSLTAAGRKQLAEEERNWAELTGAVSRLLRRVRTA